MARYDVFLVSALADAAKADLIVKRLRALKFKVRYDKKREHTTPTPRDYRDADNAQSVLVLWSKEACNTNNRDSDWVHAIAHHARSKAGVLLQAGLDKSVPDEPFSADTRYALSGMGPRKHVAGYFDLVDELGRRDGRKDLRDWIELKPSDKDGKAIWKENHPTDPLSQAPRARAKAAPMPATAAAIAAAPATTVPAYAARTSQSFGAAQTARTDSDTLGPFMLAIVGMVIIIMLVMSAAMRTQTGLPAAALAGTANVVEQCAPGNMPAYLLEPQRRPPLETGPIIDDTSER
ncbi:MAG: hypothetical protein AAF767_00155 [Pseudomonadota bacterium]